jgi:DNA-binding response OmpR family regulator
MLITMYLALDGFVADEADSAGAALDAIRRRRPDLILLDVMMPGRSGLDLLSELRRAGDLPVIMVTARGEESDRVMGLRQGADDYIVKPFSPAELVARIGAVLRRKGSPPEPVKLEFDGLTLDPETRKLTVDGRVVATTTKEFDLLAFLASSPSHVFTRAELLDKVWGSSAEWQDPGTVTEHVRRIRQLIEADPSKPRRIRTVRGVGYSFEP